MRKYGTAYVIKTVRAPAYISIHSNRNAAEKALAVRKNKLFYIEKVTVYPVRNEKNATTKKNPTQKLHKACKRTKNPAA